MRLKVSLSMFTLVAASAAAQSVYENPVDGKTYVTPGQFKTYQPDTPRDTRGQRVITEGVTLLTGEPDLKLRVQVKALADFIQSAEFRAYPVLAKNPKAMSALVQFNCQVGKCDVKLATQGDADSTVLQALYDALVKLPPLKANGEVAFQLRFKVSA
jgi:hypothetical protein